LEGQALVLLRNQAGAIILGTVFTCGGLAACFLAVMRRRSNALVLLWLGIWSTMYGGGPLFDSLAAIGFLPHWLRIGLPYLDIVIEYLELPVASLAFLELSLGKLRFFLRAVTSLGLAIGLAGIGFFIFTGSEDKLMLYNNLLAACSLSVLVIVVAVPRLSRKFLVTPHRGVLAVGTLVFAMGALYDNLSRPLGYSSPHFLSPVGFAVLLFSFAYVAVQMNLASERRLLSIENELAMAGIAVACAVAEPHSLLTTVEITEISLRARVTVHG
jgi:hypothetical protein